MNKFKVINKEINGSLEEKVQAVIDNNCSWMQIYDPKYPKSEIIVIITSDKKLPDCISFIAFDNIKHNDIKIKTQQSLNFFGIKKAPEAIKEAAMVKNIKSVKLSDIVEANINSNCEFVCDEKANKAVVIDASNVTVSILDGSDIKKIITKSKRKSNNKKK